VEAAARLEHVDVKGKVSWQGVGRFERTFAGDEVSHIYAVQRSAAAFAGKEGTPSTRSSAA
jgi:hypothetical protein